LKKFWKPVEPFATPPWRRKTYKFPWRGLGKMVLFRKKKNEKTRAEKIAEALLDKIGKEKLDDEATKLYFQGIRNFDEQMEILANKYGVKID